MQVKRISRMTGYRIFRDFKWPADLPEFGRLNVIYGWNGSGKSTLSSLFQHLERPSPVTEGRVSFQIDGAAVDGGNLVAAALPKVRVFNREFVGRAVLETQDGKLPPVYYFGKDTAGKQERIGELERERQQQTAARLQAGVREQAASKDADDLCRDQARSIKNLLTAPGGAYNNYDARNFKQQAQRLTGLAERPTLLSDAERDERIRLKDSKPLAELPTVAAAFPNLSDLHQRTSELLKRSVVSAVLSDLASNPSLAQWVAQGLPFHRSESDRLSCKFCGQSLPGERLIQLEAHFNNEFSRLKADLASLQGEIERALAFRASFTPPPAAALYEQFQAEYATALASIKTHSGELQSALEALREALRTKEQDPFKQIEIESLLKQITAGESKPHVGLLLLAALGDGVPFLTSFAGGQALAKLNAVIERHNALSRSFEASQAKARNELEVHEVLLSLDTWQEHTQALAKAQGDKAAAEKEVRRLGEEIKGLEAEIKQHHVPAEELNEELAHYLGREELQFEPIDQGYRVVRGGVPAWHLSDGERTAIAFLYFLKSLQGTDFNLEQGVVVIDDPVSSLDANSLFSAFGFMKSRTAKAGQLVVLTHNFAFFRQIQNWFKHINKHEKQSGPCNFYMLKSTSYEGLRSAEISSMDSFLTEYESEYHFLFRQVYEASKAPAGDSLEKYYALPNMARRMLEYFVTYRVPGAMSLHAKLERLTGSQAIKAKLLRFLHVFSHAELLAQPDHDATVLIEVRSVLQDLLALMQENDELHVTAMKALCDRA